MTARRRKAPHASPAFAPKHDNERYELPRTTRTEYFSDAVARHIAETAEQHPFDKHGPDVSLTVEDGHGKETTLSYNLRVRERPHAFASAKSLPSQGNLVVASQRDFEKLQRYDRYPDILKAIAAEYGGFDGRGIWEFCWIRP